ncbi:TKL family protein kinase [Tritrichomonas foetus]|uniref:TKL family protein kinase n=1 Tax=Tritrichomonas foetus TaxID=1144522 RepID=A0A1J4KUG3_9EUKA|nr:TKL family protein kinase [Tritrichomonas foetus]|eukprot:OHT13302.1 TKL family protein kinase [Tritrichomonas foetus]
MIIQKLVMKNEDDEKSQSNMIILSSKFRKKWEISSDDIEIQKEIDSGAFAHVFIGYQKSTKNLIAIKEMIDTENEENFIAFQNEIKVISKLNHFAIIPFVGAIFSPHCSIITQFMSGGSLFSRLHSKLTFSSLQPTKLSIIALGIAYGMEYVHSKGVIHRDLKSMNILLDANDLPKISDFGVAALKNNFLMTSGIGTAQWIAPEVLNSQKYNQKADVYSYGIILWEMFTGDIPFNGLNRVEIALAVINQKIRPKIPLNCPKNLARLIKACWDEDPTKRPEFKRIINALESCTITFPGTDISRLKSFIEHFSGTKQLPISNLLNTSNYKLNYNSNQATNSTNDSINNSVNNSMINKMNNVSNDLCVEKINSKMLEQLINKLQNSTQPISIIASILEDPAATLKLVKYNQLIVYLSNHLQTINDQNTIVLIINILTVLLQNSLLRSHFFQNNCQNDLLFILSEITTFLVPNLLDCLFYVARADNSNFKFYFQTIHLLRLSSYLLCVDLSVRQKAVDLFTVIVEQKKVQNGNDFIIIIENLLINSIPETNQVLLRSIVELLVLIIEYDQVRKQIISLYGPEKICSLLISQCQYVLNSSLLLLTNLCVDSSVRSRTLQIFIDEFPVSIKQVSVYSELLLTFLCLLSLYLHDQATYDYISTSNDFYPSFISCLNNEYQLIHSMRICYALCYNKATSLMTSNYIGTIIKHLNSTIPSIAAFSAISIAAILSNLRNEINVYSLLSPYKKDLSEFVKNSFKSDNEITVSALNFFGVLSNIKETRNICVELSIHTYIIRLLESQNIPLVQLAIRVLISLSSCSIKLEGISAAIEPLMNVCESRKLGIEPLSCLANILAHVGQWDINSTFVLKLLDLVDHIELCKMALLSINRIITNPYTSRVFKKKKVILKFFQKTKDLFIQQDNEILISILLYLAAIKKARIFIRDLGVIDIVDEIILQCKITDPRRPNLLRIHSYLANSE